MKYHMNLPMNIHKSQPFWCELQAGNWTEMEGLAMRMAVSKFGTPPTVDNEVPSF